VIDPKGRYVAIDDEESGLVFPDGVTAVNHGRIDGVTVNARLIRDPYGFRFKENEHFWSKEWKRLSNFSIGSFTMLTLESHPSI